MSTCIAVCVCVACVSVTARVRTCKCVQLLVCNGPYRLLLTTYARAELEVENSRLQGAIVVFRKKMPYDRKFDLHESIKLQPWHTDLAIAPTIHYSKTSV